MIVVPSPKREIAGITPSEKTGFGEVKIGDGYSEDRKQLTAISE